MGKIKLCWEGGSEDGENFAVIGLVRVGVGEAGVHIIYTTMRFSRRPLRTERMMLEFTKTIY